MAPDAGGAADAIWRRRSAHIAAGGGGADAVELRAGGSAGRSWPCSSDAVVDPRPDPGATRHAAGAGDRGRYPHAAAHATALAQLATQRCGCRGGGTHPLAAIVGGSEGSWTTAPDATLHGGRTTALTHFLPDAAATGCGCRPRCPRRLPPPTSPPRSREIGGCPMAAVRVQVAEQAQRNTGQRRAACRFTERRCGTPWRRTRAGSAVSDRGDRGHHHPCVRDRGHRRARCWPSPCCLAVGSCVARSDVLLVVAPLTAFRLVASPWWWRCCCRCR